MSVAALTIKEYFALTGSRYTDEDAKVVGPVLLRLAEEGKATAKEIVETARIEQSPLHPYFEWDDVVAAELHREAQARHMARSVMVRLVAEDDREHTARAFHAVHLKVSSWRESGEPLETMFPDAVNNPAPTVEEEYHPPKQKSYMPITIVAEHPEMAKQVIDEALRQLIGWKTRYKVYRELFPEFSRRFSRVFEAIEDANTEPVDAGIVESLT